MKKRNRDNEHFSYQESDTFIEKLKVIGIVGLPLWIILFILCLVWISECQDKHSMRTHSYPQYNADEFRHDRSEHNYVNSGTKKTVTTVHSSDDEVQKMFEREDYYDVYEYNDGLDGAFSDIDYNDITDYYAD